MPDVDELAALLEGTDSDISEENANSEDLPETDDVEQEQEEVVEEEAPNELDTLRSELDRLKSERSAIEDLKRSVGRIQSLENRLLKVEDSGIQNQLRNEITEQFGSVNELLATVVANLDESSLDAGTKQRVLQAYEASRRATEKASLRDEIIAELQPKKVENNGSANQSNEAATLLQIESAIVKRLEREGLNPDNDFDWNKAAQALRNGGGIADLLDMADQVIEDTRSARSRQAVKQKAGKGSPSATNSTPQSTEARLEAAAGSDKLDEGVALLRELGINV